MFNQQTPEIKFALHAVREAAQVIGQIQTETVTSHLSKEDRSPVTIADFASQAVVSYLLRRIFPSDPLVAEEDISALRIPSSAAGSPGAALLGQVTQYVSRFIPDTTPEKVLEWIDYGHGSPTGRYWTLDPIDGTKGFLRGDQYVVALALVAAGRVQLALLACPNLVDAYRPDLHGSGSLVVAVRGQGTWTTPLADPGSYERLQVSQRGDPILARLLRSYESGHTNVDQIGDFARTLGITAEPVRMDSQAKYAVLAAGKGDLLLRLLSPSQPAYKEKIWDQAAGSLVIEEAGGRITDLDGQPLDFTAGRTLAHNRGILASNSRLHDAALQALRTIGA